MGKLKVIDGSGAISGERDVPEDLFGGAVNAAVLHQVMTAQLAAARAGTASTKTRSEVRGGGQKPWRQKGTGRARHGSTRSPIWVGGGTVFGPKPRDHSVRTNRKMRRNALRSALAAKTEEGRVWVLEGFEDTKTKAAATCLAAAGVGGRKLLVLDPQADEDRRVDRAFRNLEDVAFALHGSLSTYDVLVADAVVFTSSALDRFTSARSEAGS
jgi:large subunit ribosomal protein L4